MSAPPRARPRKPAPRRSSSPQRGTRGQPRRPAPQRRAAPPRRPARPRAPIDPRIRERRREVAAARRRRQLRLTASLLAVGALVAGSYGLLRSPLLAVEAVSVVGVDGARAQDVRRLAGAVDGANLLDVDLPAIQAAVTALPWVEAAAVHRVPPSTIEVRVAVREPVAVVVAGGAEWIVDAHGVVLAAGSEPGLPPVAAPAAIMPGLGEPLTDPGALAAIGVHHALPEVVARQVQRYDAPSAGELRALLDFGGTPPTTLWVRFGAADRVTDKARVLLALLGELRTQPRHLAEIDLRAPDNPVLVPS